MTSPTIDKISIESNGDSLAVPWSNQVTVEFCYANGSETYYPYGFLDVDVYVFDDGVALNENITVDDLLEQEFTYKLESVFAKKTADGKNELKMAVKKLSVPEYNKYIDALLEGKYDACMDKFSHGIRDFHDYAEMMLKAICKEIYYKEILIARMLANHLNNGNLKAIYDCFGRSVDSIWNSFDCKTLPQNYSKYLKNDIYGKIFRHGGQSYILQKAKDWENTAEALIESKKHIIIPVPDYDTPNGRVIGYNEHIHPLSTL